MFLTFLNSFQDVRKHGPRSIEDLKNEGYLNETQSLYNLKFDNFLKFDSLLAHKNQHLGNVTQSEKFKFSNKFTLLFMRPPEAKRKFVEYTLIGYDDPLKFAIDDLFTFHIGFKVTKHIYFYGAIRETLQRLFEAGFFKFYRETLTKFVENDFKLNTYQKKKNMPH